MKSAEDEIAVKPSRPVERSHDVFNEVVKILIKPVVHHCDLYSEPQNEIVEDLVSAIYKAWKYEETLSGDAIAKRLYWRDADSNDANFIAILNNVEYLCETVHTKMVEQWLKSNEIRPAHKLEEEIIFEGNTAYIDRIEESRGTYVVRVPSLGHSKEGPTMGFVVPWEMVDK